MRIAGNISESCVDGPGVRYVLFTQGCPHHCVGCHNPETWDYKGGIVLSVDFLKEDIKSSFEKNKLLSGITISGGEPFEQAEEIFVLLEELKGVSKNVMVYTGYTFEELVAKNDENVNNVLKNIDYLVDGEFDITKRCLHQLYKGSTNQRIIDMGVYWDTGKIVEKAFDDYGDCDSLF